jgi:5,5'-dehydrodivanillate O-demethylase oxygenase subunit
MLTEKENELLTRVGPGTPMGDLLRRYWHPIMAAGEMEERWTKRIRLFGEDLVVFKNRAGALGLIAESCPHRRASLAYGIPTEDGIRCAYHGWKFDGTGACLEQPNEPEGSTFKDKIKTAAYPVQELGGMLFAYLGPLPAPLLTRLDGYVAEPAIRMIGRAIVPCNWLQIMENSVDPIHSEWLHGHFQEFVEAEQKGVQVRYQFSRRHKAIAFDEVPYGIIKRRLKEGQSEDCDDWRIGHPLIFPNILAVGTADASWRTYEFQTRVPVDDEQTLHLWYTAYVPPRDAEVPSHLLDRVHRFEVPPGGEGSYELDMTDHQDIMAWATQGPLVDRRAEHLGAGDRGVTLYRRILQRELKNVQAGGDPMGIVRDPDQDAVLDVALERDKAHFSDGFDSYFSRRHWRYSPIAADLVALFGKKTKGEHVTTHR